MRNNLRNKDAQNNAKIMEACVKQGLMILGMLSIVWLVTYLICKGCGL